MPRYMVNLQNQQKQQNQVELSLQAKPQSKTKLNQMQIDRVLSRKRSKEYMDAIARLDAGGHVHNQGKVNEIIDAIRAEFPEVELSGMLIGFVAVCYLGPPYEVHTLDFTGQIIEHYKVRQTLPNGMEKARSIAMRGGYAFIEVYIDCCRAIRSDGTVSVING